MGLAMQNPQATTDGEPLVSPGMIGRLGRLAVVARKIASARRSGRRRTRRVGGGVETIDLRPYDIGDDTRRIAWHAYARLERLLIRLVADEAPLRLTLVVDQSASMDARMLSEDGNAISKLRQATRIAAGFAAVALGGDDRVALAVGSGGDARAHRPVSGRSGLTRLLVMLDQIAPAGTTDMPAAVRKVMEAAPGRGVCILFSDLFEPQGVLAGAREARRRGHEVAIVEVLAPFELDPPDLAGFDLEDEETGEIVELPEHGVLERFAEALEAHRRSVDDAAREIGAVVLRATTSDPFEAIVTRALAAGLLSGGSGS
jgi:uncharacterized protein (DUF58 family)